MSCHHHHGCDHDKPHGAGHWLTERLTSVALVPLGLWLIWSAITLRGASHEDFTAWLAQPLNAGLMAATVIFSVWHGVMGTQVIIEDYISTPWFRRLKLAGTRIFFTALALVSLYSIYVITV